MVYPPHSSGRLPGPRSKLVLTLNIKLHRRLTVYPNLVTQVAFSFNPFPCLITKRWLGNLARSPWITAVALLGEPLLTTNTRKNPLSLNIVWTTPLTPLPLPQAGTTTTSLDPLTYPPHQSNKHYIKAITTPISLLEPNPTNQKKRTIFVRCMDNFFTQ